MSEPLAICIEDLDAKTRDARYLRCVALPGRQPGLRLDAAGVVLWKSDAAIACELWISADDRMILYRPEGAAPVTLSRSGRSLDVPYAKPVVLLDKDQIAVGGRRLCVHVHGAAHAVTAPAPLPTRPPAMGRLAQAAAAAAVIGAAATGCIEIRESPPTFEPPTETPTPTIEVREEPPTSTPLPSWDETFVLVQAIIGPWNVDALSGEEGRTPLGVLRLTADTYHFEPADDLAGVDVPEDLTFFFDYPAGSLELVYEDDGVPDEPPATLVFRSGDVERAFALRLEDGRAPEIYRPGDESGAWRIGIGAP